MSSWSSTADRATTPAQVAAAHGARVLDEDFPGYAGALLTGFRNARGDYLLTLDADLSHEPAFVTKMWQARNLADIVIASRYVRGGVAYTSFGRRALSRLLNVVLRRMLSVPVRDLSSGYRLYRREVLEQLKIGGRNFEVLEEILVKAYAAGLQYHRGAIYLLPAPSGGFPRAVGALWSGPGQIIVQAVEAAQLAGVGRLRRARLLQPDPDAALLAARAPPYHYLMGARRRTDAGLGMRFEHDRPEPDQRDCDGLQLRQNPLPPSPEDSRGARLGVCAAV